MAEQAYPAGWLNDEQYHPEQHLSLARRNSPKPDYLNVAERMVWFIREQRQMVASGLATRPYVIQTEAVEINHQGGYAIFKTFIRDVLGNETTDYGTETKADFADFVEKAATKSRGRALLSLGYGTAFAPELDEGERIVDTPRKPQPQRPQPPQQPRPMQPAPQAQGDQPANEQQIQSIRKLCVALGREEPAEGVLTFTGAGALIRQLSRDYNARKGQSA